uniref:Uncharacterized protein n=1 Tax=Schizaphis graminum TaxID=13262 RepID=A0A2S2PEV2_SCHGA
MRRDAVRQLRTVAGHQAAAAPQEEAAGISGGQEAEARRAPDPSREGVVLLDAVVRHDRRRIGLGTAVPGAAVRGPGRVDVAGRLRAGTGAVHYGAPRTAGRPVQLHVELVPGGMHQRRVQLQSHLRGVQDVRRWSQWRRWRWRWHASGVRSRRRRRHDRGRGCAPGQHQGLRLPAGRGLFQFHESLRRAGRHVPVSLFPTEPHAGRGRLRQATAVRRHRPLLRRPVRRVRSHVHRVVRNALRLSAGRGRSRPTTRTAGTVQEFGRTLTHRGLQRPLDKHPGRTTGRSNNGSVQSTARGTERIMTILGDELLSTCTSAQTAYTMHNNTT